MAGKVSSVFRLTLCEITENEEQKCFSRNFSLNEKRWKEKAKQEKERRKSTVAKAIVPNMRQPNSLVSETEEPGSSTDLRRKKSGLSHKTESSAEDLVIVKPHTFRASNTKWKESQTP